MSGDESESANDGTDRRIESRESTTTATPSYKVRGELSTPGGTGVYGSATATSGRSVGVEGVTDSSDSAACGVFGQATSTFGSASGVEGTTTCPGGSGVYGHVGGLASGENGVRGEAPDSDSGLAAVFADGRLKVERDYAASGAAFGRHAATVENTSGDATGDVLGLKTQVSSPGKKMNFVSFQTPNGQVGQIEGDGNGGITIKGTSADFAEYFPKADPDRAFDAGEVVGLRDGRVVALDGDADLDAVDAAMVVSTAPLVAGNDPAAGPGDASDEHVPLALVGQVTVRVRGRVERGARLVASGTDGTAVAAENRETGPPVHVGQALGSTRSAGTGEVRALVGLSAVDARRPRRFDGADGDDDLRREVDELRRAVDRKDERIADLEERLQRLEAQVDAGPATPSDD